jgi:hypothetical protein
LVKRSRKPLALFIKRETTENRIGPRVDRSQIICNPVSRDLAIRIGCQNEAVISPLLRQPSFGQIHRGASGVAGMRESGRQDGFFDAKRERHALGQCPRKRRAAVRAIIDKEHDAKIIPTELVAGAILLGGESGKASWQSLHFVFYRYSHRASTGQRRMWVS